MKITDEAKAILVKALASQDCDCLEVLLNQSCCGTSIDFNLAKLNADNRFVIINGIQVIMDDESQERVKTVTMSAENGELVIEDDTPSCCC